MKKLFTLESLFVRFGMRMHCLSSSECALQVYRMATEEAGHSETALLPVGSAEWIKPLEGLLSNAMLRAELPSSGRHLPRASSWRS